MKLGQYQALSNQDIQSTFLDYVSALNIPVIDYVAIGAQDAIHKTSTSIMSRPDWQTTFQKMNLAEHDPVRKASFNTRAKFFAFDELDYQDSCGKEVMRQRRLHSIENGVVLMRRHLGHNFMLTLATGFKNFAPYKFLIDKNIAIDAIFEDLIHLITTETKSYQPLATVHQNVDAK